MFLSFQVKMSLVKVEGIMDICEHRDAAKPLIFCVVARDGMPSKVGKTSALWKVGGENAGLQSSVNAIQLIWFVSLGDFFYFDWIAMILSSLLDWTFHKILTKLSQSKVIGSCFFFTRQYTTFWSG